MWFYFFKILNRASVLSKQVISNKKIFPNVLQTSVFVRDNKFFTTTVQLNSESTKSSKPNFFSDFFNQYLKNNPDYKYLLFESKFDSLISTSNSKSIKFIDEFYKSGKNADHLVEFSEVFKEEGAKLKHDEFLEVINFISEKKKLFIPDKWEPIKDTMYDELRARYSSVSTTEKLKILHLFFKANYFNDFFNSIAKKHFKKIYQLNNKEATFLFFMACSYKNFMDSRIIVEEHFLEIIEHLTTDELTMILYGYYKSGVFINSDELVEKIMSKFLNNINDTSEVSIFVLCRTLRSSTKKSHLKSIIEFQKKMKQHYSKLSFKNLVRLLFTTLKRSHLDETLFAYTMAKAKENIDILPIRYIPEISSILATFNIRDDEFLNMGIQKFESISNWESSKSLIFFLTIFLKHLVCFKYYVDSLIQNLIKYENVDLLLKASISTKEAALFLRGCLKIEKPEYKLKELPIKREKKIYFMVNSDIEISRWHFLLIMKTKLANLYGQECVHLVRPTRHMNKMILLRFSPSLEPQKIPESYLKDEVRPMDDSCIWLFVNFVREHGLIPDSLTLPDQRRIENLRALGYESFWFVQHQKIDLDRLDGIIKERVSEIQKKVSVV